MKRLQKKDIDAAVFIKSALESFTSNLQTIRQTFALQNQPLRSQTNSRPETSGGWCTVPWACESASGLNGTGHGADRESAASSGNYRAERFSGATNIRDRLSCLTRSRRGRISWSGGNAYKRARGQALQPSDTVLWDPSGIRAPVSSTPGPQPWTEVIVRDRRRHTRAVIPALPLGNRYEALAAVEASITPPAKSDEQQDLPRASPAQSSPPATSHWTLASVPAIGAAPPVDSSLRAEVISNGSPRVPPVKHPSDAASTIQSDQPGQQQNGYSSSRRRLLQEAVSRRSAPFPTVPPEAEPDSASPLQPSVEQPLQGASGTTATTHSSPETTTILLN
ncbi:unnamed protein product [Boreogadus saida]